MKKEAKNYEDYERMVSLGKFYVTRDQVTFDYFFKIMLLALLYRIAKGIFKDY